MRWLKTRQAARRGLLVAATFILTAVPCILVPAATVPDLYSAEVEVSDAELAAVFRAALAQVLVRVTGTRAAAAPESLAALGDPAVLVLQYRSTGPDRWRVGFDSGALRSRLDAAGLPIWSEERPATLLWLAVDTGGGERNILSAAAAEPSGLSSTRLGPAQRDELAATREALQDVAQTRGLPMLLPLVDTEDLESLSFADLWGDFSEPVVAASARYRADALLIGRTRTLDPTAPRVRWTLLFDGERWDWEGTLQDGPEFTADRVAERLATSADSLRELRVEVRNVSSLDDYGKVYTYLGSLSAVERCDVEQVEADRAIFRLQVRGDPDQLLRVVALNRLLVPVDEPAAPTDLQFALVGEQ
jgi:hypothetical protein